MIRGCGGPEWIYGRVRAYFDMGENSVVSAVKMNFDEGEATGIVSIDNGKLKIDNEAGAWYDLQGRKFSGKPTQKGVYIHNGRKEVVK